MWINKPLPEIIGIHKRDEQFFCGIKIILADKAKTFEFGVDEDGYKALMQMLQTKPFERLPGLGYRYFVVHSVSGHGNSGIKSVSIRIEQGKDAKNFDFEMPEGLISNLLWFFELDSFDNAKHLKELPE